MENFSNDGFGWVCVPCEAELKARNARSDLSSRLMHEGEVESKTPELSNSALAKWADPAHRILMCPRCGITELYDIR